MSVLSSASDSTILINSVLEATLASFEAPKGERYACNKTNEDQGKTLSDLHLSLIILVRINWILRYFVHIVDELNLSNHC